MAVLIASISSLALACWSLAYSIRAARRTRRSYEQAADLQARTNRLRSR
jgi:hypothetical protein